MAVRMKKAVLVVVLLLLGSIIISALVGEFIVRGVLPQITYKQARVVGLRVFAESEVVPFALQPNLQTNHLGYTREFDHKVRTNNLGLRGKDIFLEKQENVFRILMLGDSMTFGWGVEDEQTVSALLEKRMNDLLPDKRIEVLNAGFSDGYSPDSYYAFMRDVGLRLQPDLVIVNLFPYNDLSDMLEMDWTKTDDSGYPLAVRSWDRMVKNGYQVFREKTEWKYEIPILKNSHLAMLLFQAMEKNTPQLVSNIKRVLDVHDPPNRTNREETERCIYTLKCEKKFDKPINDSIFLLGGFKQMAVENKFRLLVVLLPSPDQAKKVSQDILRLKSPLVASEQQPQKKIREQLDTFQIDWLDPLLVLSDTNVKEYFYERDGHLTSKGTQVVAEYLLEQLATGPSYTAPKIRF